MKINKNHIVLFFIIAVSFILQKNYINEFPSHRHAWAQADRYALSMGFVNNGLNIFNPETYILNHQFPDSWNDESEHSITAVDFPIHDYIPAIFMKATGNNSVWIFKTYMLILSVIGLFYLFKTSLLLTGNYFKSFFITTFASTTPLFVYYQCGFLPSVPSLSLAFIGLYHYITHLKTDKAKSFNNAIIFLTIATLSRTTFAIHLTAILCIEFAFFIFNEKSLKTKILPVAISFILITIYYTYNNYLRSTYGSIFLADLLPANSLADYLDFVSDSIDHWKYIYLSKTHYLIFVIASALAIVLSFILKNRFNKLTLQIAFLSAIMMTGCILFSFVMIRQFPNHDYYFLDTFHLPVIIIFSIIISLIPEFKNKIISNTSRAIFLLICIPLIANAFNENKRTRDNNHISRTKATINSFEGASSYLDSLNISKDAKILCLGGYSPNIPFIKMKRKGYNVIVNKKEVIENTFNWEYDYIVLQNDTFIDLIYSEYPEILNHIEKLRSNGKITVCKRSDRFINNKLSDILTEDGSKPIFSSTLTFDSIPDSQWYNTNNAVFDSIQNNTGYFNKNIEYGATIAPHNLSELNERSCTLYTSIRIKSKSDIVCNMVVSVKANNDHILHKTINITEKLKNNGEWETFNNMTILPQINEKDFKLSIYLWNPKKHSLQYDDLSIEVF